MRILKKKKKKKKRKREKEKTSTEMRCWLYIFSGLIWSGLQQLFFLTMCVLSQTLTNAARPVPLKWTNAIRMHLAPIPRAHKLFFRSYVYWRWFWLYRLIWFLRRWNFCFLSHVEYRSKLLRVWHSLWNLKNANRISNLLLYNKNSYGQSNLFDLGSQFALWLQIIGWC